MGTHVSQNSYPRHRINLSSTPALETMSYENYQKNYGLKPTARIQKTINECRKHTNASIMKQLKKDRFILNIY